MNFRISNVGAAFILSISLFSLVSCGDLEQKLVINPDGSGTLETSIDLGEMMSMMKGVGDMGGLMNDDVTISGDTEIEMIEIDSTTITWDTISVEEAPKDPMEALMEKITDPAFDRDFDTLIAFMTIMPDSVREKDSRPDLLEKISLRMQSPANSASLNIGLVMNFDNSDQLNEIVNHIRTIDGGTSPGMLPGASGGGLSPESFLVFDIDMKAGWIRFDTVDYSAFAADMGVSGDISEQNEEMAMVEMMFGNSKIKSVVHVPGEVSSCTNNDAILTKDNRVIIEYDFLDVIKRGKIPGYTIYFDPKK